MSLSRFPPLLISLWLAELYWASPCPCRGRFHATLPLSWPHSAHEFQRHGGGGLQGCWEAEVWVTSEERVGRSLFDSVSGTWPFFTAFFLDFNQLCSVCSSPAHWFMEWWAAPSLLTCKEGACKMLFRCGLLVGSLSILDVLNLFGHRVSHPLHFR